MANTNYDFNKLEDIRSHSATLFNERLAILDYLLNMKSIELHKDPDNPELIRYVSALNKQIYKNMRMLISQDPVKQHLLGLVTQHEGVYVTDVAEAMIDRMIEVCETQGYTRRKCRIIISELDSFEILWRNILHSYGYFVRSDFQKKPDVVPAAEKYKNMANRSTLEQLRQIVGKNHKLDFEEIKNPEKLKENLRSFQEEDDHSQSLEGEFDSGEDDDDER